MSVTVVAAIITVHFFPKQIESLPIALTYYRLGLETDQR